MLINAEATAYSARARTESRGAHARVDYDKRDDKNWHKHSLYFTEGHRLDSRPVNMKPEKVDPLELKERVVMEIYIYRYDPDKDKKPYMQHYSLDKDDCQGIMLLDALETIKATQDPTLSFRRSCGGGVCGSDGMSINGKNGLACTTLIDNLPNKITLRPLPGMPVIRDLIVDLTNFFKQYEKIDPFLKPAPGQDKNKEMLQSPEDRKN